MGEHLVNRHQRRALHESGASERVEGALAREAETADLEDLRQRLSVLTADDISLLAKASGPRWRAGVARVTKLRLDPRFVRAGYGRLVLPALQRLAVSSPLEVGELLLLPTMNPRVTRHLGEHFDEPNSAQVGEVVSMLLEEFPACLVGAYLSTVVAGGAPAADVLREVLATDERLAG